MKTWIASALALLAAPVVASATADAAPLRNSTGAYELQVLVGGAPAQTFGHNGETYVLGSHGDRYTLRVQNHSGQRIEAVVSVDGRDVVDGRTADYRSKRGYLVPAYGSVDIEGWRLNGGQVAAFRFSSVSDSYAGRTGSAREVGVVGVAVFPERYVPPPPPPPRPLYFPRRDYRAPDDYYGFDESDKGGLGRSSGPMPPSTSAPSPMEKSAEDSSSRAGALADREMVRKKERPGLGTAFGERVDSAVQEVPFSRQNASYPSAVLGVRYNDRAGLIAMGVNVDGYPYYENDSYSRRTAEPFPVSERRYATPPRGWEYPY